MDKGFFPVLIVTADLGTIAMIELELPKHGTETSEDPPRMWCADCPTEKNIKRKLWTPGDDSPIGKWVQTDCWALYDNSDLGHRRDCQARARRNQASQPPSTAAVRPGKSGD